MDLAILIGIGAFIVLGIMFALLWASTKHDEAGDDVTREIIIRAETGNIDVQASISEDTQEKEK